MLALIIPLDGHLRPVDPGFGVDLGGSIDNTLPGRPPHIGGGPVRPGSPVDPGFGVPPGTIWGIIRPTDPGFGVEEGGSAGTLPEWPIQPPGHKPVFPGRPVDPGFGIRLPAFWWPVDPEFGIPVKPGHKPGIPDNELPEMPPPDMQVPPGQVLVLVRDASGKWYYAIVPQGTTKPVPVPPPTAAPKS